MRATLDRSVGHCEGDIAPVKTPPDATPPDAEQATPVVLP